MHLIRRSKQPTFESALTESLCTIKGGFTFALLTKDALYGAVDPMQFDHWLLENYKLVNMSLK